MSTEEKNCQCIRIDCFGNVKGMCSPLESTYDNDYNCPFYKTKEQFELDSAGSKISIDL